LSHDRKDTRLALPALQFRPGCYNDELRLTMGASAYLRRALLRHAAKKMFPDL